MGRSITSSDYMHARYYSSGLGRFLSVDPVGGKVGSSQSWNRYSYVLNNPLRLVDALGLSEEGFDEELGLVLAGVDVAKRDLDVVNSNIAQLDSSIDAAFDRIEAAGAPKASQEEPTGTVISIGAAVEAGAGILGGGGTYLNIGYGSQGLSISITGNVAVGGMTGGGATASVEGGVYDLPSVFDLNGVSVSTGAGAAIGLGATGEVVTDTAGVPIGGSVGLEIGSRGGGEGGLEIHSKINNTSTIVGWSSRRGFVRPSY